MLWARPKNSVSPMATHSAYHCRPSRRSFQSCQSCLRVALRRFLYLLSRISNLFLPVAVVPNVPVHLAALKHALVNGSILRHFLVLYSKQLVVPPACLLVWPIKEKDKGEECRACAVKVVELLGTGSRILAHGTRRSKFVTEVARWGRVTRICTEFC